MTLPAAAARAPAAVDRWYRQTDGRTDGRTPHYYIDPAPSTTQAASKSRRALICPGAFINPRNFTQLVKYRGATITEFYSEY